MNYQIVKQGWVGCGDRRVLAGMGWEVESEESYQGPVGMWRQKSPNRDGVGCGDRRVLAGMGWGVETEES